MSFLVKNISGGSVSVDDLGITLDSGESYDLSQESPTDVTLSIDLPAEINNGNLVILDPTDGTTPLSISESLKVLELANNPPYRIFGGTLKQLEDVEVTTPTDGYVLTYNQTTGTWQPQPSSGSGGDSTAIKEFVNQTGHGFVTGTPIYYNGSTWLPAKADSLDTLATAVAEVVSTDSFYAVSSGDINGLSSLIPGQWYYVDDSTPGTLTTTEPILGYSNPIGFAETSTKLHIIPMRAADPSVGGQLYLNNLDDVNITAPSHGNVLAYDAISQQWTAVVFDSNETIIQQTSHGFITGQPVYFDGTQWQLAQANDINTLAIGLVEVITSDMFKVVYSGGIDTGLSGLIAGSWYYVDSDMPGQLTTIEPTTGYSNPIAFAESSTKLIVIPLRASEQPTTNAISTIIYDIKQYDSDHTLNLTDSGKYIRLTNIGNITLTIPDNNTSGFPIGTPIKVRQAGPGQTTIQGMPNVSINTTKTLLQQHDTITLVKVDVDQWDIEI